MQITSSWGRTVLLLIVVIAVLQVLHLILLSRLEGRQQKSQQEPSFVDTENVVPIYLSGHHIEEDRPVSSVINQIFILNLTEIEFFYRLRVNSQSSFGHCREGEFWT